MNEVLFILVLMFGVFVQALAGFGGTLLSMPLGIMLMGMPLTKPVMTIVAWLIGFVVLITDYKYINWRELLKMTVVMLVGVFGSMWITGKIQLNFLLIIYAIVVAGVGFKKLFFPSNKQPSKNHSGRRTGHCGSDAGIVCLRRQLFGGVCRGPA